MHDDTLDMRDLLQTLDQRDRLRAGDETHCSLVCVLIETMDKVRRLAKRMKALRKRLLGREQGYSTIEVDLGDLVEGKSAGGVMQEIRVLYDMTVEELDHHWEDAENDCRTWDKRDGSTKLVMLQRMKRIVTPYKEEYWQLGIRKSAATAMLDLEGHPRLPVASSRVADKQPEAHARAAVEGIHGPHWEQPGGVVVQQHQVSVILGFTMQWQAGRNYAAVYLTVTHRSPAESRAVGG